MKQNNKKNENEINANHRNICRWPRGSIVNFIEEIQISLMASWVNWDKMLLYNASILGYIWSHYHRIWEERVLKDSQISLRLFVHFSLYTVYVHVYKLAECTCDFALVLNCCNLLSISSSLQSLISVIHLSVLSILYESKRAFFWLL